LEKSFVSDELKVKYEALIHQRYAQLGLK
jgi:hypothetical protein